MKSIRKIIEAIKLFCSCKSTCIIGEPTNKNILTSEADTDEKQFKKKYLIKISYV